MLEDSSLPSENSPAGGFAQPEPQAQQPIQPTANHKICPRCSSPVQVQAQVCPYCTTAFGSNPTGHFQQHQQAPGMGYNQMGGGGYPQQQPMGQMSATEFRMNQLTNQLTAMAHEMHQLKSGFATVSSFLGNPQTLQRFSGGGGGQGGGGMGGFEKILQIVQALMAANTGGGGVEEEVPVAPAGQPTMVTGADGQQIEVFKAEDPMVSQMDAVSKMFGMVLGMVKEVGNTLVASNATAIRGLEVTGANTQNDEKTIRLQAELDESKKQMAELLRRQEVISNRTPGGNEGETENV